MNMVGHYNVCPGRCMLAHVRLGKRPCRRAATRKIQKIRRSVSRHHCYQVIVARQAPPPPPQRMTSWHLYSSLHVMREFLHLALVGARLVGRSGYLEALTPGASILADRPMNWAPTGRLGYLLAITFGASILSDRPMNWAPTGRSG